MSNKKMKIEVFSRQMLTHVASGTVFPHTALIEVVTYEDPADMVFDQFAAHLKLVFSDVDSISHPDRMSEGQALQVADFIRSLGEGIGTLFVSCEAGMSRSPAIAAAIILALGGDDMVIWNNTAYSPNGYVYRMVLKAFGLDASGAEEKVAINLDAWNSIVRDYGSVRPTPRDIYFGIIGLCVGDALGVPVEFKPRSALDRNPLDDMVGYGTHGKPPGTWSDDTSMALALADSLAGLAGGNRRADGDSLAGLTGGGSLADRDSLAGLAGGDRSGDGDSHEDGDSLAGLAGGDSHEDGDSFAGLAGGDVIDYDDIMKKFSGWLNGGEYTADGEVFDFGGTTLRAIDRYSAGAAPLECGGGAVRDNGNGSLMRILPATFYLVAKNGVIVRKDVVETIHCLSALTHAHNVSKMACVFYCNIAFHLVADGGLFRDSCEMWRVAENRGPLVHKLVESAIQEVYGYYCGMGEYAEDIGVFERITDRDFRHYRRDEIRSSGYVVDTLEAAVWCLLNNDDYAGTVLGAVNLGGDTDTVAAVAGGLAGLLYQGDREIGIPDRWVRGIVNIDFVKVICNRLSKAVCAEQSIFIDTGGIAPLQYNK